MPVSDDFRLSMWREVLQLSRVSPRENMVVLTGETSLLPNIDAAMRAGLALGAKVVRLDIPPMLQGGSFGARADVALTPLSGHRLAVEMLKQADIVIDLLGVLHSPEQGEILAAKTRMLMVIEPPEMLSRLVPSLEDKRRILAAEKQLRAAKEIRATSRSGTDLAARLGQFPTLAEYGFADEPGHWDHWPSGFISTWPNEGSAEGRVVIDAGDMMLPPKVYVQSPIKLDIRDGTIIRIDGGFDAKYLRRHLESYGDPAAFAVSHLGWGLQGKASWTGLAQRDKFQAHGMDARAYYGNFLFSTGPNAEAGGSNHSPCHIDIPMAECSVYLDGAPVTIDGDVVAADQQMSRTNVVASK